jgi:hypothetical protein
MDTLALWDLHHHRDGRAPMKPSVQLDPPDEVVRVCAADLRPLAPGQRVYCSRECRKAVRRWRLKAEVRP